MAREANSVVRVCSKSEVAPGSVKAFAVDDKTLAVIRHGHRSIPGSPVRFTTTNTASMMCSCVVL